MQVLATIVVGSVLGACSFEPGSYATGPGPDSLDGGRSGGGDASPTSDAATVARTCRFPDATLRLCIEFEDRTYAPKVTDASAARLDAQSTAVDEAMRASGYAARMLWNAQIAVPEAQALDLTDALTIEMWIWPGIAHSANLLVNTQQYTLQLAGDGRVGCLLPTALAWSTETVEPQKWAHIACTYAANTLTAYVDGIPRQQLGSATLSGAGAQGTRIGEVYAGGLDDIRVYARALSAAEICMHAGKSSCSSGSGGGDGG